MKRSIFNSSLQLLCSLLFTLTVSRAETSALPVTQLAEGVHLFGGTQANCMALVGPEGALMVDSGQTVAVGEQLHAAVATLTAQPVRLLVNTHWHYDHVSGNGAFASRGAVVIGHAKMRARAATQPVRDGQPLPAAELPVVTFTDQLTLHFAGEEIRLIHPRVSGAHTDGDTVVLLPKRNLVHMGDLYFVGLYPYIDAAAGGSAAGIAAAIREVLPLLNDQTKVVPGHGRVGSKTELAAFADMLDDVSRRVSAMIEDGKTLEQIQQAKPTAAYDAEWGRGFFKPEQFVSFVHAGLMQPRDR